jgi:hypothetical protein
LLVFLLFIRLTYAAWLPPYYNDIGRLAVERQPLWEALAGIFVSPSRGLFIYSPFFLLTLAGSAVYFSRLKKQPLFWLIITWLFLHLLLVARTTRWWGGASFGPRILAEALPGLILLTALIGQIFWERPSRRTRQRWPAVFLYGGLAVWAIFLNSYQALFNPYTAWWHGVLPPNVDYQPDYLWNLNYPQFLADSEMLCRRNREYMEQVVEKERVRLAMSPYYLDSPLSVLEGMPLRLYELANVADLSADGEMDEALMSPLQASSFLPLVVQDGDRGLDALLAGWSNPDEDYRWSMCPSTMIAFKLDGEVEKGRPYDLWILSSSFGEQRVIVWLNGEHLGQLTFNTPPASPDAHNLIIPADLLKPGEINQLVFDLPDAVIPELPNEYRRLGLALVSFGIKTFP